MFVLSICIYSDITNYLIDHPMHDSSSEYENESENEFDNYDDIDRLFPSISSSVHSINTTTASSGIIGAGARSMLFGDYGIFEGIGTLFEGNQIMESRLTSSMNTGTDIMLHTTFQMASVDSYTGFTKKEKESFENGDSVIIPVDEGNIVLNSNNFILKVSYNEKFVVCKATKYDAPTGMIIMPRHMLCKLCTYYSDFGKMCEVKNIIPAKIKKVSILGPDDLENPNDILEFELRNRNILSVGEKIIVKMFDSNIEFYVKKLESSTGVIDYGLLYGNDIENNIDFSFNEIE